MNEEEFLKKLEEAGFKNEVYQVPIFFSYSEDENKILIDWEAQGEAIKEAQQKLIEIEEGEE